MRKVLVLALVGTVGVAQQPANPRQQAGASITMFAPEQHDLYDGQFYIRSPQQNLKNKPNREVFMHFFGMEVTWK